MDFTDKFLTSYPRRCRFRTAFYRGARGANQSNIRQALLVRMCYLLVALCFFVSATPFAGPSTGLLADFPENTQCSIDLLVDWEPDCPPAGPLNEVEGSESFELDDKDCVNRTPDLPHYPEISSRLSRLGQAARINRISEPHLRPPRRSSVSA